MDLTTIEPAIPLSPLDGRYRRQTAPLVEFLSEAALNRERIRVEVEWMILLACGCEENGFQPVLQGLEPLSPAQQAYLRSIPEDFGEHGIKALAGIEAKTRHDVKAVEYYIDLQLDQAPQSLKGGERLGRLKPLVHFGCTSEDINNVAYARSIKGAVERVWTPAAQGLVDLLSSMAQRHRSLPLLAMTHGQPATPTTLGKELAVYAHRLHRQLKQIQSQEYLGKWNGATGTYGAFQAAAPEVDWIALSQAFVTGRMGLVWNPLTTQIESHDWQSELYSTISHANRILHGLAVDMWMYISRGVFAQEPVRGATGSSTMPHKVNPIRFENAEANLEVSCALLDSLATSLSESRWQRDLTDSSTQRNIGSALAHSLLALDNMTVGMGSVHPNQEAMKAELEDNWEVLGEPIQTAMRAAALEGRPGMDQPYERVKELMRGKTIGKAQVEGFIRALGLDSQAQERLAQLTPATYTGLADELVDFERL
ncbi:Adenylosuccinate lyase [Bifidobacterium actinocoloniiforme DSM 22766]|uniref:Adenylosuccinate lyase n=1 Tax=Bifidobacterium actinocoloniiforme DSM 22766 TaxID=1437605 RepID=A0A086Z179_9BIFI|nr:adenylosuccinate lyase [Bifidobacterium actinocoloniiforme]AKV55443.1 adenylosuccinate lyase [Bifidobacterium actinocoloniiforme DSM 22766]KFI40279.1 Adenylosuccinate lyase [Bifidobacterium actinocoloniiforme DSM 22766]